MKKIGLYEYFISVLYHFVIWPTPVVAVIIVLNYFYSSEDIVNRIFFIAEIISIYIFFAIVFIRAKRNWNSKYYVLNKPYDITKKSKLVLDFHKRFIYEIEHEGYTYRTLEIADEVIEYYKMHEMDDILTYVDYIMYPAEFCNLQEDYKKAYEYLNNISEEIFLDYFASEQDKAFMVYKYWALKMESIRGLKDELDVNRGIMDESEAEKLMGEVEKYWAENISEDDNILFWKCVCYYQYHMLQNEYARAAEYADKLITYGSNDKTSFIACILNAEVMLHMKKREDSMTMMELAKEKSYKIGSHSKQRYRKYMRKFGFARY